MPLDFATPGPFTDLQTVGEALLPPSAASVVETCAVVSGLIVEPDDARAAGVAAERLEERQLRSASAIVARLLEISPQPLSVGRPPAQRVVGTCRHFALIACALLRHQHLVSRVRCGFATYFQSARAVDHWIVEYLADDRWVRLDPEVLGGSVIDHADDLRPADFLSGADAWLGYRAGQIDPDRFGVYGTENWGLGEIRGNLVRDLAALNKIETLPWDDWGRMPAGYDNTAGADYDELLDRCAQSCANDDHEAIVGLFAERDLRVPSELVESL